MEEVLLVNPNTTTESWGPGFIGEFSRNLLMMPKTNMRYRTHPVHIVSLQSLFTHFNRYELCQHVRFRIWPVAVLFLSFPR